MRSKPGLRAVSRCDFARRQAVWRLTLLSTVSSFSVDLMERHLVGFMVFVITLSLGVSAVDTGMMFLKSDVECTWSGHCYLDDLKPE